MPPAGICAGGYERSQFLLRLAILSEGVHRSEGTINQYTGDGMMALSARRSRKRTGRDKLVRKHEILITLGKHSNDHMHSFYFRNLSEWILEYGWGSRSSTHQSEYYVRDIYGHEPEAGGFD